MRGTEQRERKKEKKTKRKRQNVFSGPFTRAKTKERLGLIKWNGSDKFLRVNDTWTVPVLLVPSKKRVHRRLWSFFGTERIKIGSVPTFFFLFQRVNARPLFGTDKRIFFAEPVVLRRQLLTVNLMRFTPYNMRYCLKRMRTSLSSFISLALSVPVTKKTTCKRSLSVPRFSEDRAILLSVPTQNLCL